VNNRNRMKLYEKKLLPHSSWRRTRLRTRSNQRIGVVHLNFTLIFQAMAVISSSNCKRPTTC
jgi:hypothetical protein